MIISLLCMKLTPHQHNQHSPNILPHTDACTHAHTYIWSAQQIQHLHANLITRRRLCWQAAYGTMLQACSPPTTLLVATQQPVDHHILQLTSPTKLILVMTTGARRFNNRLDMKGIARHTAMQATEPAAASTMHVPCGVVWKAVVPRGEPILYISISPHVRHAPQATAGCTCRHKKYC